MTRTVSVAVLALCLVTAALSRQQSAAASTVLHPNKPKSGSLGAPWVVERVGDTGFVELRADSFNRLSPKQQALAYWLTQASIAIDPIVYDQFSAFGLRQKRLLEGILAKRDRIEPQLTQPGTMNSESMTKIADFAKLFWANRGNHNETTAKKFLPGFTFEQMQEAALAARQAGAFATPYGDLPPLASPADVTRELETLRASLFDPDFEPMLTAKNPAGGKDAIQSSSNTFYSGVRLEDLNGFQEHYPLNSRVVKGPDGKLRELVYRAGTADGKVPPGLYAAYLRKAVDCLEEARAYADPPQAQVIDDLARFYRTAEFQDWLKFGADWVRNDATVDFANGFIEVYRDARNAKGSSQSFVTITDETVTGKMVKLAQNAAYFEQQAPWASKYKRRSFQAPVVKAVETLIETGDFNVTTIGDNLPNENQIHEKYGTKNFLFTGSSRALNEAGGIAPIREFASSPEDVERYLKHGEEASNLLTAMHEVIGHGSGKLSERLAGGAEPYLKEYFSTLEEARADLMALWNAWDPKLKTLGLVSGQDEVAREMYDQQTRAALVQLRSIPTGDTIEEDHQRDRQMIVGYIQDRATGSIEQFTRDGKTYIRVADYQKMRQGVGMLLAELMRIKAEGDYPAIKALVEKYGLHFNPALRDEVVARYRRLNLPTYWAGINAELQPQFGPDGAVTKVEIRYPRDAIRQYLSYGAMYDPSIVPWSKGTLGIIRWPTWEPPPVQVPGPLTAARLRYLPDSAFAFPRTRKEPLTDAGHVRSALARFGRVRGVSDGERDLAFANIRKAAAYYAVHLRVSDWRQLGSSASAPATASYPPPQAR
jgi:dipeptidyl-peptidase-3